MSEIPFRTEDIEKSTKFVGNVAKRTFEAAKPYFKRSIQKKVSKVIGIFDKKSF